MTVQEAVEQILQEYDMPNDTFAAELQSYTTKDQLVSILVGYNGDTIDDLPEDMRELVDQIKDD